MIENSHEKLGYSNDIIFQIADGCCRKWFDNPSEGLVDVLIYPVVGITVDQLRALIKLEWPAQQDGWKGALHAADILDMQLLDFTSQVQVNSEGPRISLPSESIRQYTFKGPALIVAIPGTNHSHNNPVSIVIPLLRLHRGNAIAWGTPVCMRYNGKTQDKWIAQSHGKPYSPNTDGPFDSPSMTKNIAETLSIIISSKDLNKDRAVFALELFTKANESVRDSLRVRIFQYWSSIETLCNTNDCSALLKHLFNNNHDSTTKENQKLFKGTRALRHNVTHKGHDPSACPHTLERFLQVVFLDMLRSILKLNYEGYVEQFIDRHGTLWLKENYKKI
jgi:hypothetical protein